MQSEIIKQESIDQRDNREFEAQFYGISVFLRLKILGFPSPFTKSAAEFTSLQNS